MGAPWHNWVHTVIGTYGSWLYGDPRGFRAWRHRQHVDGDYKHRPAEGTYDQLYEATQAAMKRGAVVLTADERELAADALVKKLADMELEWVTLAVAATHFHLLVRFRAVGEAREGDPDPRPRAPGRGGAVHPAVPPRRRRGACATTGPVNKNDLD